MPICRWYAYNECMLASKFDMKDLGVADVILGIKILKTPNGSSIVSNSLYSKDTWKIQIFEF